MKIYACSNWGKKFLGMVMDDWKKDGHEVTYSMGYDPELHESSEVCFIDACDRNAVVASANRFSGSRLVIRCIDIEAWAGQPGSVKWKNVDGLIFGAKHIQELVSGYVPFADYPNLKIEHVPFGVDLREWTYADRVPGPNIAFVAHWWPAKNLSLALQVLDKLNRVSDSGYKLHVLGKPAREKWLRFYLNHFIEERMLDVTFEEHVKDLDAWLDDKNYLIMTGQKETFSYVVAEAAAKGIKPLIHYAPAMNEIWNSNWVWATVDGCVDMILQDRNFKTDFGTNIRKYRSWEYRDYVEKWYPLWRMMDGINEVCEIE
jgi:glycosyltransferase involved in cell wall biosynthesis